MRCDAFDQRIDDLLDRRAALDADEPIGAHAAVCPRCQATLRAHLQLLDVLGDVRLPESPLPGRGRMQIVGWMAVTAVLLVAAGAVWFHGPSAPNDPSGVTLTIAPKALTLAESQPMPVSGATLERTVTKSDPYLVHQPLIGLRLLSVGDWTTTMNSIHMPFGAEFSQVQTEWVDAVADGISPVQDSFTSTLNLIRRTLVIRNTRQS